jgi:lipopolysaccharide export LptBFGC system permease protein LptF
VVLTVLQRYILRELLYVALLSAAALTGVIFVGLSVSLVRQGLNVVQVYYIIPYVAMLSLPYAIPAAFLLACVLVFGRLSAQNEITALRAGGVNLNHVIAPVLGVGVLLFVASFLMNHYLFPWTMTKVNVMRDRLLDDAVRRITVQRKCIPLGNFWLYIGGADPRDKSWKDVAVVEFAGEIPARILIAKRARWTPTEGKAAILSLYEGTLIEPHFSAKDVYPSTNFKSFAVRVPLDLRGGPDLDRPKFLALPDLVRERARRRKLTEDIRHDPQFAAVEHPQAERRRARDALELITQSNDTLRADAVARRKAFDALRSTVEQLDGAIATLRGAATLALKQQDETARALGEQNSLLDQLRAELKEMKEEAEATAERLKDQEAQITRVAERVRQLTQQSAAARAELVRIAAEMEHAGKRLDDAKARCAEAEKLSADATAKSEESEQNVRRLTRMRDTCKQLTLFLEADAEFHFRNAGAMTCFFFALIGVPLGILSRHGGIVIAMAISFFTVLFVYYPLLMVGEMLADDAYLPAWFAQYMAVGAIGIIGACLMVRGVKR